MNAHLPAPGTRVVVPVGDDPGSLRALGPGADLAELLGGGLVVVSAVEDPHEVARRRAEIASVGSLATISGDVRIVVATDPFAVDTITADPDAVVCMATSARLLRLDGYVGSMAEKVVRAAERPSVLIGPVCMTDGAFATGRLVVADDGSPRTAAARAVADALAPLLGAGVETLNVPSGAGNPADVLVDHAADTAIIVIATRARRGLRRLFGGSTTTRIVRQAHRPVVVVEGSGASEE